MTGFTVTKHGPSRFWAVHDPAGELVCVCVYKRGAVEVIRRLESAPPSPLLLHESAPPRTGETAAQIPMETLGHSSRATVASLTIGAEQQQHTERSTP